jgi:hypothetical protein
MPGRSRRVGPPRGRFGELSQVGHAYPGVGGLECSSLRHPLQRQGGLAGLNKPSAELRRPPRQLSLPSHVFGLA